MNQNNQLTEAEKKEVQEEKRVVFFEGNSWYHRTKELMDDLTTKYSKKGGFKQSVFECQTQQFSSFITGKNRENFKLLF